MLELLEVVITQAPVVEAVVLGELTDQMKVALLIEQLVVTMVVVVPVIITETVAQLVVLVLLGSSGDLYVVIQAQMLLTYQKVVRHYSAARYDIIMLP